MELIGNQRLLGYDFEVFSKANYWCVVIIDKETNEKTIIQNDPEKLRKFHENHVNDIWIGYNSRNYDSYILKGILLGMSPFVINDELIIHKQRGYNVVKKANNIQLYNYDVSNNFHSLKQIEGFMGSKIKESSVDFNIERELTSEEINEVIEYCIHDVEQCLMVFDAKIEDFESHYGLIKEFNLDMSMISKTKTQLSAHILDAVKQSPIDDEFDFDIPSVLDLPEKYKPILDYYSKPENWNYKKAFKSTSEQHARSLEFMVAGVPHVFAYGGVHGAIKNYSKKGIILHPDVGSLYPSLMIVFNFISRNVLDPTKFKEIRDYRLVLKAVKDIKQGVYKLILNSTYGAMKDIYNALFDPKMANNVCIAGQLLLVDLISKLEDYCELIQSNTDGLFLYVEDESQIQVLKDIAKEWEDRTGLQLDWQVFDEIIQKDVNNYIAFNRSTGVMESKGSYLKQLKPTDYDLPILNKAVIEYFKNNTPVEDYINDENRLIEFQRIVKVGDKYSNAIYNGVELKEKVNRIFASKRMEDGGIFKAKHSNGKEVLEKVENTPENCFIFNDSVIGVEVPDYLDKEYYIEVAKKRIDDILIPVEEKIDDIPVRLNNIYNSTDNFVIFLQKCKENKIQNKVLLKYIQCDCCNKYGKTKKLIECLKLFDSFYNSPEKKYKQRMSETVLTRLLRDDQFKIAKNYSSIKKGQKTYTLNNVPDMLYDLFQTIPNEHLPVEVIIESQFDKFNKAWYTDKNESNDKVVILNWQNKIKPNVTAYHIKTGKIVNYKIKPEIFSILELSDKDVIKINRYGKTYGVNIVGKSTRGVNILEPNKNKVYPTIETYEILNRSYGGKTKTQKELELSEELC